MMRSTPLPAPYEPLFLDEVDSVRDELERRARDGAEEGLLVWAGHQREARGRLGRRWLSVPGDLVCGVLLRPDYPRASGAELSLVGIRALGQALAERVPAMTGLHYRWPNDVLLNGGKVAGLWLDAPAEGDPPAWLALSIAVNVVGLHAPDTAGRDTNLADLVEEPVDDADLLTAFARHLLAGLNRWAEDGLGGELKAWRTRLYDIGENVPVALPGETLNGAPAGIDDDGALRLRTADGERVVSLAEFHGLLPATG